ncbi:MAG TPA: exodeoxyribonuclease VII large subunit [Candidatus Onthocola stercoravium]|nr:exodeoxyribonuclease VII large subunit [Candidatus Onthocola stercoravium]
MDKEYLKISELNNYIKSVLDKDTFLNKVYLKGEISNFKNHTRGHLYFTLKDDTSRISAVMFQSSAVKLTFNPEDGMNVLVSGRVSAYPAQGSYQVYVDTMEPDGLGALYIEYEKLKKKLAAQGMFAPEHKVPIPRFPEKIGVITAPTGAAVRDIMSTIKRRYPMCEAILFPCLVQGKDAAPDIVRQIKRADAYGVDTIIVGRGGGSIEDLWAFNEEVVAQAIYDCVTPIISAVGHEIDWTIADFVADLRAPTPTGAAEMAVPTVLDIKTLIDNYKIRLNKNIKNMVNTKFIKLRSLRQSFILKNPMSMYEVKEQKLDTLIDTLNKDIKNIINDKDNKLNKIKLSVVLQNPENLIKDKKIKFDLLVNTLKLVNPLGILDKGYSLVEINDKIIKSSKDVNVNDILNIRLHEGSIKAEVKEVE